jgi:hypothetical protein
VVNPPFAKGGFCGEDSLQMEIKKVKFYMKRFTIIFFILVVSVFAVESSAEDYIVYSAHQNFDSRIYILRMDGSVYTYYEYANCRLVDLEVVNNEVYVAEAFCPLVYKIDLETGNEETIIMDLSLYYFYDLAFDGTYFYVTEWDLNRYDINGNKDGTASFDEDVMGGAWDGIYYWTLNDTNEIKCWDISGWPTITEIPSNAFSPPTDSCRGLWFDGEYFWTAEAVDGSLGSIYKFDYSGNIIEQWLEPAFIGWSACVVEITGINDIKDLRHSRQNLHIHSIYPNPTRSKTSISFYIPESGLVKLSVYNIVGQRIATLVNEYQNRGKKSFTWDGFDDKGKRVPPGVYLLKLESGSDINTGRIMILY